MSWSRFVVTFTLCSAACADDAGTGSTGDTSGSGSTADGGTSVTTTLGTTVSAGSSGSGDDTSSGTSADGTGSTGDDAGTASDSSEGSDGEGSESSTGGQAGWVPPRCDTVTGTGAVTFTFDEGATLTPMDEQIVPVTYTFGLVALGEPGAMLAGSGGEILASSDAGCSWHSIGIANGEDTAAVVLRAAGDTRAYGFGDNRALLVRVDDEVITTLQSPAGDAGIVGLAADAEDPDHVRLADSAGRVWDSTDAGANFTQIGIPAIGQSVLAYRAVIDPADLDHIVVGALVEGAWVSTDGADSWTQSTGFGPGNANGFNLAISPAQPDLVWAEGLDLADPNEQTSRHVYRSEDGGLTFTPVVDGDDATLINGNALFPHPTDPDVLYFTFGSNFQGYGTDVYRYDHGTGTVTLTHNMWHEVAAIEFLPGDPSVMYFGLSIEP